MTPEHELREILPHSGDRDVEVVRRQRTQHVGDAPPHGVHHLFGHLEHSCNWAQTLWLSCMIQAGMKTAHHLHRRMLRKLPHYLRVHLSRSMQCLSQSADC